MLEYLIQSQSENCWRNHAACVIPFLDDRDSTKPIYFFSSLFLSLSLPPSFYRIIFNLWYKVYSGPIWERKKKDPQSSLISLHILHIWICGPAWRRFKVRNSRPNLDAHRTFFSPDAESPMADICICSPHRTKAASRNTLHLLPKPYHHEEGWILSVVGRIDPREVGGRWSRAELGHLAGILYQRMGVVYNEWQSVSTVDIPDPFSSCSRTRESCKKELFVSPFPPMPSW